MKRIIIIAICLLMVALNFAVLYHTSSKGDMTISSSDSPPVAYLRNDDVRDMGVQPPPVVISYSEKKIYVRDRYQLKVLSGADVTWESSDPTVAAVDDDGVVTALKSGSATVRATDADGNSDECVINAQKVAYLTIDDNPTVSMTPKFIQLFDKYDIKVTLFLCAQKGHDELYEKFYQAGHTLSMHGFSHNEGKIYFSTEAFSDNIEKEREFLMKATSAEYIQNVIRFPTGSGSHKDIRDIMLERGFCVYDWTALFEDSYITSPDGCYDAVMSGIDSDCEIILMHHMVASYKSLDRFIPKMHEMGYEFATITEETTMWYF